MDSKLSPVYLDPNEKSIMKESDEVSTSGYSDSCVKSVTFSKAELLINALQVFCNTECDGPSFAVRGFVNPQI